MRTFLLTSATLLTRETVRFLRQKNRIIGSIGTPLVFWFLIGSGLTKSFEAPVSFSASEAGLSYLQYFFPGTIVLMLLFTAIFSTISIIEDRREGFLQGVLVAPIPRSSLVLGKLLGGATLATAQGLLFTLAAPFLGLKFGLGDFLFILIFMFIISFGLTGLGFIFAWRLDSTQGFHAIMNLVLMPLWLLSGSLFPIEGAPRWLEIVMRLNPVTYAVAGLQGGFFGSIHSSDPLLSSKGACLLICLVFSLATFWLSVKAASKEGHG